MVTKWRNPLHNDSERKQSLRDTSTSLVITRFAQYDNAKPQPSGTSPEISLPPVGLLKGEGNKENKISVILKEEREKNLENVNLPFGQCFLDPSPKFSCC